MKKQKIAKMEAVPADVQNNPGKSRDTEGVEGAPCPCENLSLYYDAPHVDQERFRAGLEAIIKELKQKEANLMDEA